MYLYRLERPSKFRQEPPFPPSAPSQPITTLSSGPERPLSSTSPASNMGETQGTESCPSPRQMDKNTPSVSKMDGPSPGQAGNDKLSQLEIDETAINDALRLDAGSDFATGFPLACLMTGLMVAQFLVSIDRTIISTVSQGTRRGHFTCADRCPSRPSRTSHTSSSRHQILGGMARHTCSRPAPSSQCLGASSRSSRSRRPT
jgi:hypothetical protein